ncbi:MAG: transporter substrate-binding domain-containing protein [Planctomycetota bacterium]|jgi:ABC-type amino acid transport substrate-binding protein
MAQLMRISIVLFAFLTVTVSVGGAAINSTTDVRERTSVKGHPDPNAVTAQEADSAGIDSRNFAIQERAIIAKGVDACKPYSFLTETGNITGFNNQLFQAAAVAAGLNAHVGLGNSREIRQELLSGKIDVMIGACKTPEWAKSLDFSIPYVTAQHSIFVREDSDIKSIADLSGMQVIVARGAVSGDSLVQGADVAKIVTVSNTPTALRLLASGEYDCALLRRLEALHYLKQIEAHNIKSVGETFSPTKFRFAVKKDNLFLLFKLNEGLSTIRDTGEYDQLYNRWFGSLEKEGLSLGQASQYGIIALLILMGVPVGIRLWSWWSLKRYASIEYVELSTQPEEYEEYEEEEYEEYTDTQGNDKVDPKEREDWLKGVYDKATPDASVTSGQLYATLAYLDAAQLLEGHSAPDVANKIAKELDKCETEFAKAEEELANGHPDRSIDHFKTAWQHAQNALDCAEK